MTTMCYPDSTDWSCAFTADELEALKADPVQAAKLERSEALAWYTLASLTAFQIGVCPTTVRPCAAGCDPMGTWMVSIVGGRHVAPPVTIGSFTPHIDAGGQWVNACACRGALDCSCTALCEAILPGPVGMIVRVVQDGTVLPATSYRVDNGNRLVRTDGECWPACQDLSKPATLIYEPVTIEQAGATQVWTRSGDTVTVTVAPNGIGGGNTGVAPWQPAGGVTVQLNFGMLNTLVIGAGGALSGSVDAAAAPAVFSYLAEPGVPHDATGTFEVTYYRGAAPNPLTEYAAGVLANEFYLACSDKQCRLPSGVTTVTRQGVSYQIVAGSFPGGFTGIHEVDAVIRMFNPNALTSPPRVVSPDVRGPRTTTWAGA